MSELVPESTDFVPPSLLTRRDRSTPTDEPPSEQKHRPAGPAPRKSAARTAEAKARAAASAEVARGVLIQRLDDALLRIRDMSEKRYGLDGQQFLSLIQDVQWALFPEAFCEPDEPLDFSGLIPREGLARVTAGHWDRLVTAMAERVTRAECASEDDEPDTE